MDIVSVILPTYNRANYIKDAIESVLNQTYRNIELIIIDDGSADNTQTVIEPYLKDNRVRYIKQENAGAAAARNRGMGLRIGKYVAFIDSDDIWEKDKLEIQLAVIDALPEVIAVFSDFSAKNQNGYIEHSHIRSYFGVLNNYRLTYTDIFDHIFEGNIKGFKRNEKIYWGNIYKTMIFGNIMLTSTCLFLAEVFNKIGGFDITYGTLEDYDLFLRVTRELNVAFIDKPLAHYRYNTNQLSGELFFGKLCNTLIDIFKKNIMNIKDKEFLRYNKKKIKQRLGMYQAQQAYYNFVHENMTTAVKCYLQSIRNNPSNYNSYIYLLFSLLPISATRFVRKVKSLT